MNKKLRWTFKEWFGADHGRMSVWKARDYEGYYSTHVIESCVNAKGETSFVLRSWSKAIKWNEFGVFDTLQSAKDRAQRETDSMKGDK